MIGKNCVGMDNLEHYNIDYLVNSGMYYTIIREHGDDGYVGQWNNLPDGLKWSKQTECFLKTDELIPVKVKGKQLCLDLIE